jgi:CheY-like chemotaxis protein
MTSPLNSPLSIVLADDDKDDCFLFDEVMEEIPLTIDLTIVHDGVELMDLLSNAPDNFPHVLFLDLNMPRKNGFECLADIRADANFSKLPIVIFSTSYDPEVANRLYKKGAYYYMRKPSSFSKLKKVIHQALSQISQKKSIQPPKDEFVLTR